MNIYASDIVNQPVRFNHEIYIDIIGIGYGFNFLGRTELSITKS